MLYALGGCQLFGFVGDIAGGTKKIKAQYELEEKKPLVVVVDDPSNQLPAESLTGELARTVSTAIVKQKLIDKVIPPYDAERVIIKNEGNTPLSLDRIGKAVNAQQVLYLVVLNFSLSDDERANRSNIQIGVKLVDVDTGRTLFPPESSGLTMKTLKVLLWTKSPDIVAHHNYADKLKVARGLVFRAGDQIAKLFYEHEPPGYGQRFDGR